MLISPSVPCRKHWDVTRQIKSLAQLIRSAQNGWGGDLWLLCEGFCMGGDGWWCDLMSPVWHEFIQNLGIPLEVKWTSCNLNGIFNSKHISVSTCAKAHFLAHTECPPEEKWNVSTLLCRCQMLKHVMWVQEKLKLNHICRISCSTFNESEC